MSLKNLLYITIITCVLLPLLISCSESTKTERGNVSGYVILEDDGVIDYSGITVALYNTVKLDTTIVRLNIDYPHIGVHISQETEFDHRLQDPIKTEATNPDGSFILRNVPAGQYNFVAHKEGWGFLYKHSISITGKTIDISDLVSPLQLYPEIIVDSHIFDEFVCEPYRHYIFEDNTVFHQSSHLVIYPQAYLRIKSRGNVSVFGSLTINQEPGKYFRLTSNDGFDTRNATEIGNYASFTIEPTAEFLYQTVSGGIFSFGNYTLVNRIDDITVTNSIFSGLYAGCFFEQVDNITVTKSLFRDTKAAGQASIIFGHANHGIIEDNIYIDNKIGIQFNIGTNFKVANSYFVNNEQYGILNWYDSDNIVLNCVFLSNNTGIGNGSRSYIDVKYSIFNTRTGLYNLRLGYQWAWPTVNFSSFNCSSYAVITKANFHGAGGIRYFDVTNNYWSTTNPEEIKQQIWDRNNENEDNPDYGSLLGIFVYEPFLNQPNANVGIMNPD